MEDREIIARIINPYADRYVVDSIPERTLRSRNRIPAPARLSMRAEFAAACALRDRGMELARNIFEEKRDLFPRTELTAWAGEVTASLLRNRAALLSLCKLRCDDVYLLSHSVNTAVLSAAFAMHLGVREEFLPDFVAAGFLHDVGKLLFPSIFCCIRAGFLPYKWKKCRRMSLRDRNSCAFGTMFRPLCWMGNWIIMNVMTAPVIHTASRERKYPSPGGFWQLWTCMMPCPARADIGSR